MNKTILALAIVAVSGGALAAQPLRLSEIPPGAIHTPGIGPGYIFPSQGTDMAIGAGTMPATSMVPGAAPMVIDQEPAMGMGQAWALERLRVQGFTRIQGLRQAPDGSWHALAVQRGGMMAVTVDRDGSVSVRER
ncbi:MAG: hypothetical protein KF889_30445 [Alphaproteobacteria bacterium]|nr:hypothetical protein [Alphaproteobacteria bacterium]MCW5739692.1 hypothetical protein [Alphaproteobacteria bacterium]